MDPLNKLTSLALEGAKKLDKLRVLQITEDISRLKIEKLKQERAGSPSQEVTEELSKQITAGESFIEMIEKSQRETLGILQTKPSQ
jgi:hypothetical protein